MNNKYSISKPNETILHKFQLNNLGTQIPYITIGKRKSDYWGTSGTESKTYYKETTEEDYDGQFTSKLSNLRPPYISIDFINYHFDYYLKNGGEKDIFLKHIKYVILPLIKKMKGKDVYEQIVQEWMDSQGPIDQSKHSNIIAPIQQDNKYVNQIQNSDHSAEEFKKVFITYSWDSTEHKQWVKNLADKLLSYGIHVSLDQYDISPGDSITNFMEKSVKESDKVIVILTPSYKIKSLERKGGVGYEQQIITGEIMSGINRNKFIPIIVNGSFESGEDCAIPPHFMGISTIDFRTEDEFINSFENLARVIYESPQLIKPPKGNIPSFLFSSNSKKEYVLLLDKNFTTIQSSAIVENMLSEIADRRRSNLDYKIDFKIDGISDNVTEFIKLDQNYNLSIEELQRKNALRNILNQEFYLPNGSLYDYLSYSMNAILDHFYIKNRYFPTLNQLSNCILNCIELYSSETRYRNSGNTLFDVFNYSKEWVFKINVTEKDIDNMYSAIGIKEKQFLTAMAGLDVYDLTNETFNERLIPKLAYSFTLNFFTKKMSEVDIEEYFKISNWKIGLA